MFNTICNGVKSTWENMTSKITNYFFKAAEHTVFSLLGITLFYNNDWLYNISMMDEYEFDIKIYGYYCIYILRYINHLAILSLDEKDFGILTIHHVMTICLLLTSIYRYTRIGVIIALTHDIADIFLNTAKGFKKLCERTNINIYDIFSKLLLICFIFVWLFTRIILNFNILEYIYYSRKLSFYSIHPYAILDIDEKISILLLLINFILQLYWQILIIKFVWNIFKGNSSKDEKGESYKFKLQKIN